jgi:hypothetical protein
MIYIYYLMKRPALLEEETCLDPDFFSQRTHTVYFRYKVGTHMTGSLIVLQKQRVDKYTSTSNKQTIFIYGTFSCLSSNASCRQLHQTHTTATYVHVVVVVREHFLITNSWGGNNESY